MREHRKKASLEERIVCISSNFANQYRIPGELHVTKCFFDFRLTPFLFLQHDPLPQKSSHKNPKESPMSLGKIYRVGKLGSGRKWINWLFIHSQRQRKQHNLGKENFGFIIVSSSVIKDNHPNANTLFKNRNNFPGFHYQTIEKLIYLHI